MLAKRSRARFAVAATAFASLAASAALAGPAAAATGVYHQRNLVSDIPGVARITDPNLVNPWGVAAGPVGALWVNDNATDVSTLYAGGSPGVAPSINPLVVGVPGGEPTGIVANQTSGFVMTNAVGTGPAAFVFATEAGTISAWRGSSPLQTTAVLQHADPTAIYKGLALAHAVVDGKRTPRLYAADFHNAKIAVFDDTFAPVALDAGAFTDPSLPAGFAPFNVQHIGQVLYVAYAKQDGDARDDVSGPGNGFVDVYSTNGRLLKRLISNGALNSPWGLARAPETFGRFRGDLLVGNQGDGRINAYDPNTGAPEGTMINKDGNPITIDGLWALSFGNATFGSPDTLTFTAGLSHEAHGLLGVISPGA